MQALTFEIRLLEPLLAGQAYSGEENSTVASSFIPGSMLRGALIGRYLRNHGTLDAGDGVVQGLFFDGTVRYLNGYPLHPRQESRMLPTPRSWYGEKDKLKEPGADLWDGARQPAPDGDKSYKPVPDPFCWWPESGENVQFVEPTMQQLAHNYSLDRNRKVAGHSGVFRYESIAPGQRFAGAIIAPDGEEGSTLLAHVQPLLLEERYYLGGSRTGGYGAVELSNVRLQTDWKEYDATPTGEDGHELVVTLLSDALLRHPKTGEMVDSLHEWLGVATPTEGAVSFHQLRRVGGFNRKWGLPLPQAWALQAGSVFLFDGTEEMRTRLKGLVESGIGERRAEGFGRIALDWMPEPTFQRQRIVPTASDRPDLSLSSQSRELLHLMVQRQLEAKIDEWLNKEVAERAKQVQLHGLSATQLSRARLAARRAWYKGELDPLSSFFSGMTKRTDQSWRKARLRQQPLPVWIKGQLESSATLQPIPDSNLPQLGPIRAQWSESLRARTTARLIEGVLRRAVRKAKSEQDSKKETQNG